MSDSHPVPPLLGHRAWTLLHATETETEAMVNGLIAEQSYLEGAFNEILWVSDEPPQHPFVHCRPNRVQHLLGRSFEVVVINAHQRLDPNLLGQCHGFVWGGGALFIRLPPKGVMPSEQCKKLEIYQANDPMSAFNHESDDHLNLNHVYLNESSEEQKQSPQTSRFYTRLLRVINQHQSPPWINRTQPRPVPNGSKEQSVLVQRLAHRLTQQQPTITTLIADRGRGKSAALGLTIKSLAPEMNIVICAQSQSACGEVIKHAGKDTLHHCAVITPQDLIKKYDRHPILGKAPILIIDEAAQFPVPALQRITRIYAQSHLVFASTAHGYEGSGRGFTLRFVSWLSNDSRPIIKETLHTPIRWDQGDALEAMIFDALILDLPLHQPRVIDEHQYTEPAKDNTFFTNINEWESIQLKQDIKNNKKSKEILYNSTATTDEYAEGESNTYTLLPPPVHRIIDRSKLAESEHELRDFFGLLVHAHYRTTPSDLELILDSPNVRLHGLWLGERCVAATLVALEGVLPLSVSKDIYWGRTRLRGHALPETLISHSGVLDAGALSFVRSVRITVHPAYRRLGWASLLVDAVHQSYTPDLFGTLFGATEALLSFRRHIGYELVRVGASRGTRTGEPAAIMIRPVSTRAKQLLHRLRGDLARTLPTQLPLLEEGGTLLLSDSFRASLLQDLPHPRIVTADEEQLQLARYAFGALTQEAARDCLLHFVSRHTSTIALLDPSDQTLLMARIIQERPWVEVAELAQLTNARTAMRRLRKVIRQLVNQVDPTLETRSTARE